MRLLIVVDMQADFISAALANPAAQAIVPHVREKIRAAEKAGDVIIFTMDTHYDDYLETQEGRNLPVPHCISDTPGWEIHDSLNDGRHTVVLKNTFGYYDWEKVISKFTNHVFEEIELIGVCTGICVVSNTLILKALFPEVVITVDAKACACLTPETHEAALTTMRNCQVNVING